MSAPQRGRGRGGRRGPVRLHPVPSASAPSSSSAPLRFWGASLFVVTRRGTLEVELRGSGAAERLLRGHPWVWRDSVARGLEGASPGDEVQVVAPDGAPIGRGLA